MAKRDKKNFLNKQHEEIKENTTTQEIIIENKLENVEMQNYAYPDQYIEHGSVEELEKIYGLDETNMGTDLKCLI